MKNILKLIMLLCTMFSVYASKPDWSKNIASTIYSKCTSCHHDGGIAPFSLMTYQQTISKKSAILHNVEDNHMPPYPANTTFREYAHQKNLSPEEKQSMIDWINNDAPEGDISIAPKPPEYTGNSIIKNPDFIASMSVYTSQAKSGGLDEYKCFVLNGINTNEQFISGIEVIPGNPEIVHHVLIYQDTSSVADSLDALTPEPGYNGLGGVGSNTATLLGVYAPGTEPYFFPKGFGLRLQKNAKILLQVHYPAGSADKQDQTTIRFLFNKDLNIREVKISSLLDHQNIIDGPLIIPANQKKTFHQRYVSPINASIFAVLPHMHLIGKSTKIIGITPSKDTIKIIDIPEWDFHWQMAYTFKTLQKVPKGTVFYSEVEYDNTTDNHHNPSNPPKLVTLGEGTTDEMMLTFFYYTPYKAGDELISLENIGISTGIAESGSLQDYVLINNHIVQSENAECIDEISMFDLQGKQVYTAVIDNQSSIELPYFNASYYLIRIKDKKGKTKTLPYMN